MPGKVWLIYHVIKDIDMPLMEWLLDLIQWPEHVGLRRVNFTLTFSAFSSV